MRMRVEEGSVSAVSASPAAKERSSLDPVRALQHALYRAAKADPGRRFHADSARCVRLRCATGGGYHMAAA